MCGIAGLIRPGEPITEEQIARSAATISHRGPDQMGIWRSGCVALAATRLKVIDPSAGAQPMHYGPYTLVFNGEVYNHKELRAELEAKQHVFQTTCDTEVVLHAFAQWGRDSFRRLRGMFAIAVWSEKDRELTLVRDLAGIKPLFYLEEGSKLYFGSEIKTIFSHPEVKRRIDLQSLDAYMGMNYVPGRRTMAAGVCKLQPGHFMTWRDGKCLIESYAPERPAPKRRTSFAASVEELDHLLHASVKEQLVADVPLGLWLSGGLDSSTLVHYASQHVSVPIKTFSITFRGRSFDESSDARAVSEAYGTEHHEFNLGPEQVTPESILDLVYYADDPIADAGAVPAFHLSRVSAREVTVALSGEGSDELFGGYMTYAADRYARLARFTPKFTRRTALMLAKRMPASDEKIGLDYKLQRFLEGSLLSPQEAHVFWNGTHSARDREHLLRSRQSEYTGHVLGSIPPRGDLRRFLDFDQKYFLTDDILTKVDRMSMAHSLEVRPAFLDPRIVDFAAALPIQHCIKGRATKRVLRTLMQSKLPPQILSKGKQGLDIPVHEWLRGHLRPLVMETLNEQTVKHSGLFHWPSVARMLELHMRREANLGYHLWGMLMLFLWMRQWKIVSQEEAPAYALTSSVTGLI